MSSAAAANTLSGRVQPLLCPQDRSDHEVLPSNMKARLNANSYQEVTNEQGIINLFLAHNGAISDIVLEKLNDSDLLTWDVSMLPYTPDRSGIPRLRKAIADFLTWQFGSPQQRLDPEKVVILNGVTACISMMAFVLCDPGDFILTPAPMYGTIKVDVFNIPGVHTYTVQMSSETRSDGTKSYQLTLQLLESTLKEARDKGHRVKALLLINPVNPQGTVYSQEEVVSYLHFCKRHDLHCIIDEIYGSSVYDPAVKFSSVLAIDPDELPDRNRTHVLWGTAKDFGIPGTPMGAVYSWNDEVIQSLKQLVDFHQVPHFSQMYIAKLLEDKEWVQSVYLPTNRKRLRESSKIIMATLDELGVAYVRPSAGLFIWADFRKYLPHATQDEEKQLCSHVLDKGVAIRPASVFYATEFGWFRIVFAVPRKQLLEAMRRLKDACSSFSVQS